MGKLCSTHAIITIFTFHKDRRLWIVHTEIIWQQNFIRRKFQNFGVGIRQETCSTYTISITMIYMYMRYLTIDSLSITAIKHFWTLCPPEIHKKRC